MAMTPIIATSTDAKTLASVLSEITIGNVVTYQSLSEAIGRDVQSTSRGALATARKIVLKERRMVFDCVMNVGLKRLSDAEIVAIGDKTRSHMRRAARNATRKIVCADYNSMTKDLQVKHNTSLSLLGVIAEMATEKASTRLESHISKVGTELPVAKATIAALGI